MELMKLTIDLKIARISVIDIEIRNHGGSSVETLQTKNASRDLELDIVEGDISSGSRSDR